MGLPDPQNGIKPFSSDDYILMGDTLAEGKGATATAKPSATSGK